VMPIDIARQQLQEILKFRWEGLSVDGLVIFDTPHYQEADLPFAEMIVEELEARGLETTP